VVRKRGHKYWVTPWVARMRAGRKIYLWGDAWIGPKRYDN
jgi:hypothetical protein